MKVVITDKRACTAFDVATVLKWNTLDPSTPTVPDDSFPAGSIVEVAMYRDNGGSYLYRPPMSVEEFMQRCSLWETVRTWWHYRKG
jgi:hypothetical protein